MIIFGFGIFTFTLAPYKTHWSTLCRSNHQNLKHTKWYSYPKNSKIECPLYLPIRKSFSFTRFLWWFLLGFVVSSTSLNLWVVVEGEGGVVVVVVGVVVLGSEPLPWMTFCSRGQQILGMLFVKPQENFERNFSFSFVIWFSRIFSAIKIKT